MTKKAKREERKILVESLMKGVDGCDSAFVFISLACQHFTGATQWMFVPHTVVQGSGTRSPPAAAWLLVAPLEANTLLGDQGGINPLSPPSESSPMPALPPDKYSSPELMPLEEQDLSGSISPAKSRQDP
ncbi:hypothetical protein QQF64_009365 [Cirrhinus molitorella]|uniref:Uncharacterized protein n=1 Tax=Cirrhinus molitorella TaxID=172907 RepID=A0ABR3M0Z1_9TELE